MPLESIDRLMRKAERQSYAVGYFESWSLESIQGVIDAAEQTRSPVIIGFNGQFLSDRHGGAESEVLLYARLGQAVAQEAKVPCGLIFNECAKDSWVEMAISAGFGLVMLADPHATVPDYTRRVRRLTTMAHAKGAAIEAEVDELPHGSSTGTLTDPKMAAEFVAQTDVDLLAISVGNEHVKLEGRAPLDLKRLEAIRKVLSIPLVLHGGSGVDDAALKSAIQIGVRKVNYGTYIKQRYLKAIRLALASSQEDPHALLGNNSPTDTIAIGRAAVRDAVLERIHLLGCADKA
jgi:fructose-bisphosphate aldolase class II